MSSLHKRIKKRFNKPTDISITRILLLPDVLLETNDDLLYLNEHSMLEVTFGEREKHEIEEFTSATEDSEPKKDQEEKEKQSKQELDSPIINNENEILSINSDGIQSNEQEDLNYHEKQQPQSEDTQTFVPHSLVVERES